MVPGTPEEVATNFFSLPLFVMASLPTLIEDGMNALIEQSMGSASPADVLRHINAISNRMYETEKLKDMISSDPFQIFEGTGEGKKLCDMVKVTECSRTQGLEGHSRTLATVQFQNPKRKNNSKKQKVEDGSLQVADSGFFTLHFDYDRRPSGRVTDEEYEQQIELDASKAHSEEDVEEPPQRPISFGLATSIKYMIRISQDYNKPEELLVVEVEGLRDRAGKDAVMMEEEEEEPTEDKFSSYLFPEGMGLLHECLLQQGVEFEEEEALIYLLLCFQYYDMEFELNRFVLECALGGEEGSEGDYSDTDGSEEEGEGLIVETDEEGSDEEGRVGSAVESSADEGFDPVD